MQLVGPHSRLCWEAHCKAVDGVAAGQKHAEGVAGIYGKNVEETQGEPCTVATEAVDEGQDDPQGLT